MPRLLADAVIQQATVQPATDRVAFIVKGSAAGLTTDLTEWQTSGGTILGRVDQNGNFRSANTKGLYLDMASGGQGYVIGTAANQLDIRGGSAGLRVLNNAGSVANLTVADNGATTLINDLTVPNPTSSRIPTPTNYQTSVPVASTGSYLTYNPLSAFAWHDLLAFNRWWGAPTFETFTSAWAADTLNNALWAGLENGSIQVVDGVTKTAARWTWNSSNIAFSAVEWWLLGFTYAGATAPTKNFLIELSSNGTSWTTIHTSTGNTANGQPALLYAPMYTADTWVRLTITVTNAQQVPMSTIRALSTRWGNQGGGSENTLPYSWDATQRMAIGAGAVAANAPLTVGTNTTASTGGIYFGTDTPVYRSGAAALTVAGSLTATGTITSSASFNASGTQVVLSTTVEQALRLVQANAWADTVATSFIQGGPNTPNAGGLIIQGGSGAVLPRLQLNSTKIVAWDGAYGSAPVPAVATTFMAAASAAGNIPLVSRGFTSQTAALQEWQNVSATALTRMTNDGRLLIATVRNFADDGPQINLSTANLSIAHPGNQSTGHVSLSSNDSHILRLHSSLQAGGYNPAAIAGDNALIYSNGSAGTGALLLAPWHATSCGLRMDANASTTITSGAIGSVPLRVRGASGQTANLLDIMDGTGAVASAFSPFGSLKLRTTTQFGGASSAALSVQAPSAASEGIVVRGFASQTANLQEWQDTTPTLRAFISPAGQLAIGSAAAIFGSARISISTVGTGSEGIITRATSGQTASLQEWQDNLGVVLSSITATGAFKFAAGAVSGKVLTSDGTGVGSWQTPAAGGTVSIARTMALMGA